MGQFDGLRAIVTGGASGIGLATAARLADGGARVGILDLARSGPVGYLFAQASIADDTAVRAAVADLASAMGGLDVLVNNAGIGAQGGVEDNDDAEWARVVDINVTGPARVTRAALAALRQSHSAAVVNVSSVAATVGLPQRALYSASKGGVLSLTLAMAADCSSRASGSTPSSRAPRTPPGSEGCLPLPPTRPRNAPRLKPGSRTAAW